MMTIFASDDESDLFGDDTAVRAAQLDK